MSSSTYFNGYNFVVNSFILEKIHSYKLSLNEFLLLMYFLNVDDRQFVLSDLKKHLKLSKEEVLSALNVLIEKGIIILETKKDDSGVIHEYVSLSKFFDLLDDNDTNEQNNLKKVIDYITKDCKIDLSKKDIEIIKAWVSRDFSYELIKESVDNSLYNGKFDIRYIDSLLYETNRNKDVKKEETKLFDYDWLEEDKK